MRTHATIVTALAFAALVCLSGQSSAQEQAHAYIPARLVHIGDQSLRDALTAYTPNYDSLPRNEQIAAYVTVQTSLAASAPQPVYSTGTGIVRQQPTPTPQPRQHRYEPWNDPSYNPYREEFGILSSFGR